MRKYFEKIYQDGFEQFVNVLETKMDNEEKTFVITANAEIAMYARENKEYLDLA